MIELLQLNKSYRMGEGRLHVLKDIDLRIEPGEMVAIMGSSGSGKSTLLNVLGLLDGFDSGRYLLDGHSMADLSERQAAYYRSRYLGFVFQSFNLLPFKDAVENVALPLYYQGVPRRRRRAIAEAFLERVGLGDRLHHLPTELSGGQQQRVAIARALVSDPKLILADEPTGALDSETSEQIMSLLTEIHQEGKTLLVVTHEPEVAGRCQRIIRLRDGRIIGEDRAAA